MTQFEYEAKTRDGGSTVGSIAARSRRAAGGILQKQDLFVVRLRAAGGTVGAKHATPHATKSEVAWQMWQLAMMIETGLGIADALACLSRQARRPPLHALLQDIERRIREGASMSVAMEAHPRAFPSSLIALVRASELSGAFKDVLRKASQYLISDLKTVRRFRGAMVYPAAMLFICLAVTVFLLTVILPKFAGVFAAHHATLPLPTRILIGLSDSLVAHWGLVFGGAAAAVGVATTLWRSAPGRAMFDRVALSAPLIGPILNALYQSRCFTAMALMIESHVPLLDAIRVARAICPSDQYQRLWSEVEDQVRVGERMAVPLQEAPFISESVAQVIDNGDRNGKLGLVFSHLSEYFEEEYKRVITTTMQLLEPALIVVMGSIVGFVAVALMLPLVQASRIMAH